MQGYKGQQGTPIYNPVCTFSKGGFAYSDHAFFKSLDGAMGLIDKWVDNVCTPYEPHVEDNLIIVKDKNRRRVDVIHKGTADTLYRFEIFKYPIFP